MSEPNTAIAARGGPEMTESRRVPTAPTIWRLLETPATDGAQNMAIDTALMDTVRNGGEPILRFYRWWPPCISLGRNQPARGHYDVEEAERRGIEFVRRPTGGRAVYHHHEVTYSVTVRDRQLGGPRRTYEAIHKSLLAGLRLMGAATEMVGHIEGQALRPSTLPCFDQLDGGAIIAHKRKLLGSAQCREGGVLLQHGSLLLSSDQSPTWELLKVRGSDRPERLTSLDEVLSYHPTWGELVDGLASGFERLLGIQFVQSVLDSKEKARTVRHHQRFADPEWTWRL